MCVRACICGPLSDWEDSNHLSAQIASEGNNIAERERERERESEGEQDTEREREVIYAFRVLTPSLIPSSYRTPRLWSETVET